MEENNEKFSIDTENLKNETVETAKKVKESVKGANIKEETKATKGFLVEMFKNPLETIKEVAQNNSGKYFKTALFLVILWTVLIFIGSTYSTIHYWGFSRVFANILSVLKRILAPALGILVYSIIALVMNKNNKKSLIDVISTVTITQIPFMLATLVSLLTIISSKISIVTSPFAALCQTIAIVLGFFGFKYLFEEECKTFIKKYVVIQLVYQVCYVVIGLLGIYI